MYSYLEAHIKEVRQEIAVACQKANRSSDEVLLIGVTKTHEADVMNAGIDYGLTDIAENRVQEIMRKYDDVQKGVKWHLIGHLQTNKVKYIIDKVALIHSLDSLKLADEINKRAQQIDKIQEVLIQVNVAGENQKFGIDPKTLPELIEHCSTLSHIRVLGLMNIAPNIDNKQELRQYFRQMKQLLDTLNDYGYDNIIGKHLSMGMSGDYDIAIEEGSTMIRVGTKIFGRRDYSK